MWGTPTNTGDMTMTIRFIPTHVGNTHAVNAAWAEVTVHPHACGEHTPFAADIDSQFGSSPRMWGTH